MFMTLHRLEAGGFLSRSAGNYRLTRRGRDELAMTRALVRLTAQTVGPMR